jgi:hypothetical protein
MQLLHYVSDERYEILLIRIRSWNFSKRCVSDENSSQVLCHTNISTPPDASRSFESYEWNHQHQPIKECFLSISQKVCGGRHLSSCKQMLCDASRGVVETLPWYPMDLSISFAPFLFKILQAVSICTRQQEDRHLDLGRLQGP